MQVGTKHHLEHIHLNIMNSAIHMDSSFIYQYTRKVRILYKKSPLASTWQSQMVLMRFIRPHITESPLINSMLLKAATAPDQTETKSLASLAHRKYTPKYGTSQFY